MFNEEKFIDTISKVDTGNYTLRASEMRALYDNFVGNEWGLISNAFKAGFLKGQRAERNKNKKCKKKSPLTAATAKRQRV